MQIKKNKSKVALGYCCLWTINNEMLILTKFVNGNKEKINKKKIRGNK